MSYKVTVLATLMAVFMSVFAIVLSVSGVSLAQVEEEKSSLGLYNDEVLNHAISFLVPTTYAAVRTDHGLPMTNVPYRYSAYFFILAIIFSNVYRTYKKGHDEQMPGGLSWGGRSEPA
jgi:hypothetical protein